MGIWQTISSLWRSPENVDEKIEDAVTEEGAMPGVGRPAGWVPTDFDADQEGPDQPAP
jgi:hypothetical protein